MNNLFRKWGVLLLMGLATATAQAKSDDAAESLPAIPDALSKVEYITDVRPKENAKVYFLFQSRSTCGHCVRHTPEIIAQYKRMRGKGAEVVLLSADADDAAALKWAESTGMNYPVVKPAHRRLVPFKFDFEAGPPPPLPLMIAVTADGEPLGQSGGAQAADLLKDWRKMVNEAKKAERKRQAEEKKAAAAAKKAAAEEDDAEDDDEDADKKHKKSKKAKKKSKKTSKKSKRKDD